MMSEVDTGNLPKKNSEWWSQKGEQKIQEKNGCTEKVAK